jgi:hypothetical protein
MAYTKLSLRNLRREMRNRGYSYRQAFCSVARSSMTKKEKERAKKILENEYAKELKKKRKKTGPKPIPKTGKKRGRPPKTPIMQPGLQPEPVPMPMPGSVPRSGNPLTRVLQLANNPDWRNDTLEFLSTAESLGMTLNQVIETLDEA